MVWLIGGDGMLGSEVAHVLDKNMVSYVATDGDVDITDERAINKFVKNKFVAGLNWIINCAAYTAVDNAEDHFESAKSINSDALINVSRISKLYNAKIIHISTDYVFDGTSLTPYKETDATNPQSVYGKTKLLGEQNIINNVDDYYIIRTAWLYGRHGKNFVSTMINLMNEKKELYVVDDQVGSPTYAVDLANTIYKIIVADNLPSGIYNYSNEGMISWYDFAVAIYSQGQDLKLIKNTCKLMPCTSDKFVQKAKRPSYSLLDKTKIKEELRLYIPCWNESLKCFMKELIC